MAEDAPDLAAAPTTEPDAPGAPAQRQGGLSTDVLWSALTAVSLTAEGGAEPVPKIGPGAAVLLGAQGRAPKKTKLKAEAKAEAKAKAAEPASSDASCGGGHTPESIARLPPKLRARLLQRGILKEQDVRAAEARTAETPASEAAVVEAPAPEAYADAAVVGEPGSAVSPDMLPGLAAPYLKAPPESPPPLRAAEIQHGTFEAATAGSDVRGDQEPASAAISKTGSLATLAAAHSKEPAFASISKAGSLATLAAAHFKAAAPAPAGPPPRVVYAAAPVLSSEAMRKRAAAEESEGASESAKRQRDEAAAPEPSPATLRAAAAKAQGGSAPTWTYRDGVLSQDGVPLERVQEAAPAPAAATSPTAAVEVPSGELPLPPGWVRVPHEGDFYFWNTTTDEVSWEHPAEAQGAAKKELFQEEHKVLWTDLGKIIGRQGMSLKIMKASLGCTVKVPRQGGKGVGKGKAGKGKGKDEGKVVGRGIGTGETPLTDDQFATVVISGETKHMAMAGKRTIEIMLGYGRNVERALGALGIEVKMPSVEDMPGGKEGSNSKEGVDPMDPAAYSETPMGGWSAGLPKPGGRGRRCGPEPRDAKTANAERF